MGVGRRPDTVWQSPVDNRKNNKCGHKWVGAPWGRPLMLRGGARGVHLSLDDVGDAFGAIEEARGTTRHELAKLAIHKCCHKWVGRPWGRSLRRGAPRSRGGVVSQGARLVPRTARRAPRTARRVPRTAKEGWLEAKWCVARDESADWSRSEAAPF